MVRGKSVAVHLCNKKLIRKVPILLHTGQNECSVLTTAVYVNSKPHLETFVGDILSPSQFLGQLDGILELQNY